MTVDNATVFPSAPADPKKPDRPPESYIANRFDQQLWADLPTAAFSLAALYVIFAFAHPLAVGGETGLRLTALASTSALVLFLCGRWLRRSCQFRLANRTAALFAAIVLANVTYHLLQTRDSLQFTNFMLLVVAIGAFFLSLRWCLASIAVVGLVWGAAIYLLRSPNLIHNVFAFVSAALIAGLAFRFRTHALRRFLEGEWSENRHLEKLVAAESELIRANIQLEDRVAARTRELREQIEQTRRMEQAALESEKLATTGRMAAILAHEINNPLDTVVNCLHLLDRNALPPADRSYLELAGEELQRVVRITRHTLGFYRRGAKPGPFDCSAVAADVIATIRPMCSGRGVRLEERIQNSRTVDGVSDQIRQLLTNFIMNAIDAEGTLVRVRVVSSFDWHRPGRGGVRISVSDNGKGIDKEHGQDVFEPFFTTKGEKGTGLGLWVCKSITQSHDGNIVFRSMTRGPCRGSVFSVFLPSSNSAEPYANL